jgi:hypothetical protein
MKSLGGVLFVLFIIAGVIAFNIWVGGASVQYVVEYWGTYIQHKPVHVPFTSCAIAVLFLAEISVLMAIVTWLVSFILFYSLMSPERAQSRPRNGTQPKRKPAVLRYRGR